MTNAEAATYLVVAVFVIAAMLYVSEEQYQNAIATLLLAAVNWLLLS